MAEKTTLKKAKEIAQKVWDSVPTREEVWDSVPTREDILNLPKNIWGHVPTQTELQKTFDDIYRGAKDFDPVEFLGTVVGYTLEKGSDARESFNRLLKHDPRVAALFFDKIEGKTFNDAYEQARKQGLRTFIWETNGKVYSTEYKGSPKEQMDVYGLVNEQLQDRAWWQRRLADNFKPFGYNNPISRVFSAVVLNKKEDGIAASSRMDYFNTYVGRPQKNNTLGISDYIPTDVSEINGKKLPKGNIFYKDNQFSEFISKNWALFAKHLLNEQNHKESRFGHLDMGHFKMSLGQDDKGYYICYHDTWDLAPTGSNADFGKPFELYDRIYFDPNKLDECFQQQRQKHYDEECYSYSFTERHKLEDGKEEHVYRDIITGRSYEYIYDENGNRTSLVCRYGDGKSYESTYDKNGNETSEVYRDADGKVTESNESTYDENGNRTSLVCRDADGKVMSGFGPAYEEALKKQKEDEEKETTKTQVTGKTARQKTAAKTAEKPYYGHRAGGIDDTIAKLDAQERQKMTTLAIDKVKQG